MKRIITCISILAGIVILSVISLMIMKNSNDRLFELIDKTEYAYENNGDTDKLVNELLDYWDNYYIRISYVAQSSALDDISYAIAKLPYLLKDDSDEFMSELKSIRRWTEVLYNSQYPHLYSVF